MDDEPHTKPPLIFASHNSDLPDFYFGSVPGTTRYNFWPLLKFSTFVAFVIGAIYAVAHYL